MGVKGLWSLLNPVSRPVQLESMEGKRMAIDSSIWLYQFQATMRDKDGRVLVNAHVLGFLRRINKLLFHGIKPVFVFDGGAPTLKRNTIAERKRRKAGAAANHAKMAERLFAAQMRREAVKAAQALKEQQAARAATRAVNLYDDDAGEQIAEDAVYLEDLEGRPGPSRPRAPTTKTPEVSRQSSSNSVNETAAAKKKKDYKNYDPYRLPEATVPSVSTSERPDARLATEEELKQFIDEVKPEDVDVESPEFRALPTEVQYEIIGDLRVRSRQQSHRRLTDMLRAAPSALDFSMAQIKNLSQRNHLTQQLLTVTDMVGKAHLTIPVRIAAERNREYVLVKRGEDQGGGWALGIREGTKEKPIVIDPDVEPTQEESESDGSDIEELEDPRQVQIDADLRENRRREILEAIASRYAPKTPVKRSLDTPIKPFGKSRQLNSKPLFEPEEEEEEVVPTTNDEALALALQQEELGSDEEEADVDLARALALSRQVAEKDRDKIDQDDEDDSDDSMEEVSLVPSTRTTPQPISETTTPIEVEDDSDDGSDFEEIHASSINALPPVPEPTRMEPLATLDELLKETQGSEEKALPSVLSGGTGREGVVPPAPTVTDSISIGVKHGQNGINSPVIDRKTPNSPITSIVTNTIPARPLPRANPIPVQVGDNKVIPTASLGSNEEGDGGGTRVAVPTVAPNVEAGPSSPSKRPPPRPAPSRSTDSSLPVLPSPLSRNSFSASDIRMESPQSTSPPIVLEDDITDLVSEPETLDDISRIDSTEPGLSRSNSYARTEDIEDVLDEEDDSRSIEWSKSPSPPGRPPLQAQDSGVSIQSEPDLDVEVDAEGDHEDGEMGKEDMVAEEDDYARFMAQIKHRDLNEVRGEIDDEIRVLHSQAKVSLRDSDEITQAMVSQIQTLLRHFGIPYITAPMEAEAQCAKLAELNLVDGIITDDSDVFLFGGKQCFKNIFNDAKYAECFLLSDLDRELSLTRERLISLAYLLGSDYTIGLPGVGPVVAMELMANFPGERGLDEFKAWWIRVQRGLDTPQETDTKWKKSFKKRYATTVYLSSDWPNFQVREAYKFPEVDASEEPFHWGFPKLSALRTFLHEELSWSISKVDDELTPIVQRIARRGQVGALNTQTTLLPFFDASPLTGSYAPRQRTTANVSKRLMAVIKQYREAEARIRGVEVGGWGEMMQGLDEEDPKGRGTGKRRVKPSDDGGSVKDDDSLVEVGERETVKVKRKRKVEGSEGTKKSVRRKRKGTEDSTVASEAGTEVSTSVGDAEDEEKEGVSKAKRVKRTGSARGRGRGRGRAASKLNVVDSSDIGVQDEL